VTVDQVRYTLKNLHERKFFARARVGQKTFKYMLGVTDDQLRTLLLQRETHRQRFKAERTKKDAELMAAIKSAERQSISVGKDQNPLVSAPTQSQHRNGMIPDIVPDINSCFLNNGSCNNSTENSSTRNTAPATRLH